MDALTGAEVVGRKNGNHAGILIPYFHPESGQIREYRLRRDQPDLEYDSAGNFKVRQKYLSAPGRSNMLYLPPGVGRPLLRDPAVPVMITFPATPGRASVLGEFGGLGFPMDGHLWWTDKRNWGYRTYSGLPALEAAYEDPLAKLSPRVKEGLST